MFCFQYLLLRCVKKECIIHVLVLTATDASLAATESMSAQETTPGHIFSTSRFAASMTSNPLVELLFGRAVFSL